MAKGLLLDRGALASRLEKRFLRNRAEWLTGGGAWPLQLPLGVPTETEAQLRLAEVDRWQRAWRDWSGPGTLVWIERRWPRLGTQRLPQALGFDGPRAVAAFLGRNDEWRQAEARLGAVRERWPAAASLAARHWPVLAEWPEAEFERLLALLDWLVRHPGSGLLPRQLPVPGVDGKWLERHRRVIAAWLAGLGGGEAGGDLIELAGLRRPPARLRLRLLDPRLRAACGGLGDIEAPLPEIARLELPVRCAFIVENLQTGLAFDDLPGSLVFMQQGYDVAAFGDIPWLRGLPVFYWGDIDTHGLAILDRLRAHLPQVRSLLMDEATLLAFRELWGHEPRQAAPGRLDRLQPDEARLYQDLRRGRWGPAVRLEQERIAWPHALERLQVATGRDRTTDCS